MATEPRLATRELAALIANELEDILGAPGLRFKRQFIVPASLLAGAVAAATLTLPRRKQEGFSRADQKALIAAANEFIARLANQLANSSTEPDLVGDPEVPFLHLSTNSGAERPLAPVSEWAGPVAGPTFLETQHGIPRSTLHRWQRLGEAIAFRTGGRKHVFPLLQFVDGRPVPGLAELVSLVGNPRATWLWLMQPCPALEGERPVDLLRKDLAIEVLEVARKEHL